MLAQAPDAPWKETRDGGTVVCMTEAVAVDMAKGGTSAVVEGTADKAALISTDPSIVKVVIFTVLGVVVGGAIGAGTVCAVTGGCR